MSKDFLHKFVTMDLPRRNHWAWGTYASRLQRKHRVAQNRAGRLGAGTFWAPALVQAKSLASNSHQMYMLLQEHIIFINPTFILSSIIFIQRKST